MKTKVGWMRGDLFRLNVSALTALLSISLGSGSWAHEAEDLNTALKKTANVYSGKIDRYSRYYMNTDDEPKTGEVKVTFLGTTSLMFDDGETQILIDVFFSRPSIKQIITSKIKTSPAIVDSVLARVKANRIVALFTAHSHYDHAFDVAYLVNKTHAKLYGSESTLNIGRGGGLSEDQMVLFEPGKKLTFGKFTVTVLASKHSPAIPGINDDLGKVISSPLAQPAKVRDYKEGGSFDFLITHGEQTIFVKPSCNFIQGALDHSECDLLFLGTASLGMQNKEFQKTFYEQTVRKLRPQLVIPVHWDNFFQPLSEHLNAPMFGDNLPAGFDFLIGRLKADKIRFGILQGYQSVIWPPKAQ